MFAIVNETLHLADAGTATSHYEWMVREKILNGYSDPAYEKAIRGYYIDEKIVAYRGRDFLGGRRVRDLLFAYLPALEAALKYPDTTGVWTGGRSVPGTDIFEGAEYHGKASEIKEFYGQPG